MLNFIAGVFATWFLLGLGYSAWWSRSNFYTFIMELPVAIVEVVVEIICYPFIWIYCVFLRHTIHPVSPAVMEVKKILVDSHRVCGNIYFCYDKKARAFRNKIFFFRIDPTISNPNKPSVPDGEFRFGA